MKLISKSFSNNSDIPVKYCLNRVGGGQNISPGFIWEDFPSDTRSFVLTMVDHHPIASNWVHWIITDIPAVTTELKEGISNSASIPNGSIELINTFGMKGYGGPSPPPGSGKHNYDITIYALNIEKCGLSGKVSETELEKKIKHYVLDKVSICGYFGR